MNNKIRHLSYVTLVNGWEGLTLPGKKAKYLSIKSQQPLLLWLSKADLAAINYYQNQGLTLIEGEENFRLLAKYWALSTRQISSSVLLANKKWLAAAKLAQKSVLIVLAHPNPKSFNHAIAKTVTGTLRKNGYRVIFHDLYQENFPPLLPKEEIPEECPKLPPIIEKHCWEIGSVNGIIIIHPNWWWQPPAILKGWIDRVWRAGVVYRFIEGDNGVPLEAGLLMAKKALLFNTADASEELTFKVFGNPLENLWYKCGLQIGGVKEFSQRIFCGVLFSTPEQRQKWLTEVAEIVNRNFPGKT